MLLHRHGVKSKLLSGGPAKVSMVKGTLEKENGNPWLVQAVIWKRKYPIMKQETVTFLVGSLGRKQTGKQLTVKLK